MTPDQLKKLLTRRESATVERKESARELPRSLFESVCAFLNQDGGTILLGVANDGKVVGVETDAVERLTAEIVNDGIQRVSLRDKIFREIVANLLVHREYTDAHSATLIIYRDRVETTNAAHPHGQGPIAPEHFAPYSKNPTLSKFFMQMGRGEELGSGVLNVSKYLPLYTKGAKPQFVEGNPFTTVIPVPAETGVKSSGKGAEKSREKSRDRILKMIRKKPTVTTQEMMDSLGLSRAGVEKVVKKLKQERRISRVGPDKGGHWEVVKDQQP